MSTEIKGNIKEAILAFTSGNLTQNALSLFSKLGYNTERQASFNKPSYAEFKASYTEGNAKFKDEKALVKEWKYVDLLFQLSKDEVTPQNNLFDTKKVDDKDIQSYLFFVIELSDIAYSRTALAQITREVNKLFPMPVMILFKTGNNLTLSVINRRLHKKDESKDVLEKVTLIKDISIENPHRAHIEILFDLSFDKLLEQFQFINFIELHNAWQKTLDTKELNKRFYQELSNWYFWAKDQVQFPADIEKDDEKRNSISLIRLITRIVFIWFVKEKNLVPDDFFNTTRLSKILKEFNRNKKSSSYYSAILQNLFFGTLNQKMDERGFVKNGTLEENKQEYGVKNMFRYADLFSISEKEAIALFENIPFLNGGLFDCLDKPDDTGKILYSDGFSRNPKKQAIVPDFLFFGNEQECDLNEIFGTRNKHYKVKGLIEILSSYKFTIAENTPLEEEVALDPELLGKVFENLLASYNPETQTTARKQTGSFYTPREIVNYMVDESLIAYFKTALLAKTEVHTPLGEKQTAMFSNDILAGQLSLTEVQSGTQWQGHENELEANLRQLLSYTDKDHLFDKYDVDILITAIDSCKILDPACGSGAFPMGILHKLVLVLHKLDPKNEQWKKRQIQKAKIIDDSDIREKSVADIEEAFKNNELDYGRKLYLIENCIYGVDIQPIAVQIAKLRFFISLIIDQNKRPEKDNLGIRSLPNLETKFVAANTLVGLPQQGVLRNVEIDDLEAELKCIRHDYFSAKTRKDKLAFQKKDKQLRTKIAALLEQSGWNRLTAMQVAQFDPYDQNKSATFFDVEWMFGFKPGNGFNIVIGNPPYVRVEKIPEPEVQQFKKNYLSSTGKFDLYFLFFEVSISRFLNSSGLLSFICSYQFLYANSGIGLRKFLVDNTSTDLMMFSSSEQVFDSATTYTGVFIARKSQKPKFTIYSASFNDARTINLCDKIELSKSNMYSSKVIISNSSILDELNRSDKFVPCSFIGSAKCGVVTSADEVFYLSKETVEKHSLEKEIIHPVYGPDDIDRFTLSKPKIYCIYPYNNIEGNTELIDLGLMKKKYNNLYQYLILNKPALIKRSQGRKDYEESSKWYQLNRPREKWIFDSKKLIYAGTANKPIFALDDRAYLFRNARLYGFVLKKINIITYKYLIGIFNSTLAAYFASIVCPPKSHGYCEFSTSFVDSFPISRKSIDEPQLQEPIAAFVDQIIILKSKNANADTVKIEREIDMLVYKLYKLSEKDISVIETRGK